MAAEAVPLLEDRNPQWYGPNQDFTSLHVVEDIPGRGKGAIATQDISKGELVMSESAVLVGMMEPPRQIATEHLKILDVIAFEQLAEAQRKRLSEMATVPGREVINGIFHTNAFGIGLSDDSNHRAVFPEIARINHDCDPNCYVRFSRNRLRMEVIAYRDIEAGEELSVAYTPLNIQTEARQKALRLWGFNCTCSLCTKPHLRDRSDRNRQRIQGVVVEMGKPENRNHQALTELSDEMLELIGTEKLTALLGDFYGMLAESFSRLGDSDTALKYANLALTHQQEFRSPDHKRVGDMRKLVDEIRNTKAKNR
ncbi:hypothetical protein jhhlp_002764 [Lomentospora prolificans]|uniref:SET domain-containing protein n=1 Tax=Lomentospora prolificans TaxID=41688 RepID=A0A2N3NF03_9PEZI|nr:hypothetical protein jhhlp_002764 [Lomentospora prolificans]